MATVLTAQPPRIVAALNPLALTRNLWRHRELIVQLTRRDIEARYRGSILGIFWALANPLLMLGVYTFVFGVILNARWPQARTGSLLEFAVIVFCGLTAFGCFGESVSRAPGLIVTVPNYVKRVVFPLEVLAVSSLGAALFQMLISLAVLLAAHLLSGGGLAWTLVLLPVVCLPLIFLTLGVSWLLASLGVYLRDAGQAVVVAVQVLFFLTPIFYSLEIIPEPFRTVVLFNPLAPIVENFRRVILWERLPSWPGTGLWILATGAAMMLGYAWFMQTRKGFADVL